MNRRIAAIALLVLALVLVTGIVIGDKQQRPTACWTTRHSTRRCWSPG